MRLSLGSFALFLGVIGCFITPIARSSVDTSFLPFIQENLLLQINDESRGIQEPVLKDFARQVWQEVVSQGFTLQGGKSDKALRTVFSQVQAHSEALLLTKTTKIPYGDAVWIIHTPLIATPLVTQGKVNAGLISPDILADDDQTRVNTALWRAQLVRDFLAKGGIIIAVYQAPQKGRTEEQVRIFEALKAQYPRQLIDFAIDAEKLKGQFPVDKIGATYLMRMANHEVIEMSLRGNQINHPQTNAIWGIWLQERAHPRGPVTQHLTEIFQFLEKNGLKNVLQQHAKDHGISSQKVFALITPYIS